MNRRTLIKSLAAVATLGGAGTAVYNFLTPGEGIPLVDLPKNKALVAELAETIIPRTNTPGAKDAGVEHYIIKMITENTDTKMQRSFLAGLKSVETFAESQYGKPFIKCNQVEKNAIMTHFEEKATYTISILNKVQRKFLGAPFFYQLRDLAVEGYCTSQIGATQGMAYDYVPVSFEPCIPLKPGQLSWATK